MISSLNIVSGIAVNRGLPEDRTQTGEFRQGLQESCKFDVVVVGDSMVKHIDGVRLSRRKRVTCTAMSGAMVKDIAMSSPCESLKPGGELIIHAGTNNGAESVASVSRQIAVLCESVVAEGFAVTISSIIHRRWESADERKRVDDINRLLEIAAQQNNWGYINNGMINELRHLGHDGVHLNRAGVRLLAANLSRHISRGHLTGGRKSYAEAAAGKTLGSSKYFAVEKGPVSQELPNEGQRVSANSSAGEGDGQDFHEVFNRVRLKPTREEWHEYLQFVRMVMNE